MGIFNRKPKVTHVAGTQAASDDLIATTMLRAFGMTDAQIKATLNKTKADERKAKKVKK